MSDPEERHLEAVDCGNCGTVMDLESDNEMFEEKIEELQDTIKGLENKLEEAHDDLNSILQGIKDIMKYL